MENLIDNLIAALTWISICAIWAQMLVSSSLRRREEETRRVLDAVSLLETVVSAEPAPYARKSHQLWGRVSELYTEWLDTANSAYASTKDARVMFLLFVLDSKNVDLASPSLPDRDNWDGEDHPIQARLRNEVMGEARELLQREAAKPEQTDEEDYF